MARIFVYDGKTYEDPDPDMPVENVKKYLANFIAELATATVTERQQGFDTVYEFTRRVGTKGS